MLVTKGNGRTDNRRQRQEGINGWDSECWTSRANPLLLCVYCIPYVTTQSSPYFARDVTRQCEGYIRNRKHDHSFKKYHLFRGYQGLLHKLISRWSANTGGIQLTGCIRASEVQKKEGNSMLLCPWECFSGLSASLIYPWWGVNPLQPSGHTQASPFLPTLPIPSSVASLFLLGHWTVCLPYWESGSFLRAGTSLFHPQLMTEFWSSTSLEE